MSSIRERIIEHLKKPDVGITTSKDIAAVLKLNDISVRATLSMQVKEGTVRSAGRGLYVIADKLATVTMPTEKTVMQREDRVQRMLALTQELVGETMLSEDRIRAIVKEEVVKVPPIVISLPDGGSYQIDEQVHPKFAKVLRAARTTKNVLLVGKAGTGKTFLARQVATALNARKFGTVSVSPSMSESWLLGRYVPDMNGGRYVPSDFIDIYENGGVFLIDEMGSAGAGDIMMVINQALANGRCPLPMRPENPIALRHENCIIIGATNVLNGADNVYTSQTGLEGSTRDRFAGATYLIEYDTQREEKLAEHGKFPKTASFLWKLREAIQKEELQHILSSRVFEHVARFKIVDPSLNDDPEQLLLELEFWNGWTSEEISQAKSAMKKEAAK